MQSQRDDELSGIIGSLKAIAGAAPADENNLQERNRCYAQLCALYNVAKKSGNQEDMSRIDEAIQDVKKIACKSLPKVVMQMQAAIDSLARASQEAGLDKLSAIVRDFNDVNDRFSATTYNDATAMNGMREQLKEIHAALTARFNDAGASANITLNPVVNQPDPLILDDEEFNRDFKKVRVLAAGNFGECSVYQYAGDDDELTSIASQGYLVIKEVKERANDGPLDEDARKERQSASETHEREAALASRAYDGVALKANGKTYIATRLMRNDLSKEEVAAKTAQLSEQHTGNEAGLSAAVTAAKLIGKSTTAGQYLNNFYQSICDGDSNDQSAGRAATSARDIINTVQVFSQGIDQALREVHAKGFSHCDFFLKNIMVVERNGKLTLQAIDFGFSHKLSERNGSHQSIRQDIYYAEVPDLIKASCDPTTNANQTRQQFSIEDDFVIKRAILIEVMSKCSGVKFSVSNLLGQQAWREGSNEKRLNMLYEAFTKSIATDNRDASYQHEIAEAFMQAFHDYLTILPAADMTLTEKIAHDQQAFALAAKQFDLICAQKFGVKSHQHQAPVETPAENMQDTEALGAYTQVAGDSFPKEQAVDANPIPKNPDAEDLSGYRQMAADNFSDDQSVDSTSSPENTESETIGGYTAITVDHAANEKPAAVSQRSEEQHASIPNDLSQITARLTLMTDQRELELAGKILSKARHELSEADTNLKHISDDLTMYEKSHAGTSGSDSDDTLKSKQDEQTAASHVYNDKRSAAQAAQSAYKRLEARSMANKQLLNVSAAVAPAQTPDLSSRGPRQ